MAHFFEQHRRILVAGMLIGMFALSIFTMIGDSAIVDEIAHIPAGYSYVALGDFRLNPEHPPLLKDLAGLPLLLFPLDFPKDHASWITEVNGQWEAGWHFLYHYGNNADLILFFARLPILLMSVLFGLLLYIFVRKNFGTLPALLTLFFYSLSPNFLAHNHLVTTDLGIAFFIFLALTSFGRYLQNPTWANLVWATLGLAGAQLAKFSAVLLAPFYLGLTVLMLVATAQTPKYGLYLAKKIKPIFAKRAYLFFSSLVLMGLGALALIWIFYAPHTINFPPDKQAELIRVSLPDPRWDTLRGILIKMAYSDFFQPLAQYLLGVAMVFGRVAGGNTTYFLGEVSNQSFKWYFPVSYLLKTPVPLIFLLLLTAVISASKLWQTKMKTWWKALGKFLTKQPLKPLYLLFIVYYVGISISGNLNLGIRHLFPVLPLIYILVSEYTVKFFSSFQSVLGRKLAAGILFLLLFWYGLTALFVFPHYISYHNEIIGGGKNAYLYFTDSNVDWGQDLKRLAVWLKTQPQVTKLKLDYFGGGEPKYYFCNRAYDEQGQLIKTSTGYDCSNSVYQEWHSKYGPTKGWIAVSVTFLQNARFYAARYGEPDYDWLRNRKPYVKIGNSIFVYWVR